MPVHHFGDFELYYRLFGKGETALLFIHGLGGDGNAWRYQVEYFKNQYAVTTIDLFGHGKSSKNVDPVLAPRLDAEAIDSLMRQEFKRPYFAVGHSFASNILPELIKLGDPSLKGIVFVDCPYQGFEDIIDGRTRFARSMLSLADNILEAETRRWYMELMSPDISPEDRELILSSLEHCHCRWLFESAAGCREYNRRFPPAETPIRDNLPVFIMEGEYGIGMNLRNSWVNHFKDALYCLFGKGRSFFLYHAARKVQQPA